DELRRGVQEIAFLSDPTVGELRIGSASPYIDGLVPNVIARVAKRFPRIQFRVTEMDAVTLCGMLRDRNLDLVLGRVPNSVFGDDLTSEFLFEDCMHVVAGATSPWALRRRVNLPHLSDQPWLMPETDSLAMALISDAFRSYGLAPPKPQVIS